MSIIKTTGTQLQIASAYAAAKSMTALSNATSAVASLESSHGVGVNDYVEITSAWDLANGRIVRAAAVATNDVTLAGLNTSSVLRYPAGSGIGSVREISTWLPLSQLTGTPSVSGGDQQFADVTTWSDVVAKQMPTLRSPVKVDLGLFFDPSLSWWNTVKDASDSATPVALRMVFASGAILVGNAYWGLQEVPTFEDSTLRGSISLSFVSVPTIYTS